MQRPARKTPRQRPARQLPEAALARHVRPLGPEEPFAAYLSPDGFLEELLAELGDSVTSVHGRLVLAAGSPQSAAWAANIWLDPRRLPVRSIGDAAAQLRSLQRNWALYSFTQHRRAALIEERLPKVSAKPLRFGDPAPTAPLGSWTLLAPDLMLASPRCSSPFRHGEAELVEDKEGPPNRAYLKLWEALTLAGARPGPGDTCLDLGASPGGWTWVLQRLGARVVAVDKAPLDPAIAALPGVEQRLESAFGLDPVKVGPVDWLLSDVICYPERLLRLIESWLASGLARRFICTVKLQGPAEPGVLEAFKALPGGRLVHLHHNKHELTWMRV